MPAGRDPEELEREAERCAPRSSRSTPRSSATGAVLERGARAPGRRAEQAHAEEERRVAAPGAGRGRPSRGAGPAARPGQRQAQPGRRGRGRAGPADAGPPGGPRARRARASATSPRWRPASPGSTPARRASTPSTRRPRPPCTTSRSGSPRRREEAQVADRERSALTARREALELGLNRKDGAGALLAATEPVSGLLGSVAALLTVRTGYETAVAAALGTAADAVAVDRVDAAVEAIGLLKDDDLGRAGLLLGGAPTTGGADWPVAAAGRRLRRRRRRVPRRAAPPRCAGCSTGSPSSTTSTTRVGCVAAQPDVTAVTRHGDLIGSHFAAGGSASVPSLLEVQAAVDEATEQLTAVAHSLRAARLRARTGSSRSATRPSVASTSRWPSCTSPTPTSRRSPRSSPSTARWRGRRRPRPSGWPAPSPRAEEARDADLAGLAELEQRLAAAEESDDDEPTPTTATARRGGPCRPRAGDRGPAGAADHRGARPRPGRSRGLAGPRRPSRSATPGPARSRTASGCAARVHVAQAVAARGGELVLDRLGALRRGGDRRPRGRRGGSPRAARRSCSRSAAGSVSSTRS